jgi:hypothetical protein
LINKKIEWINLCSAWVHSFSTQNIGLALWGVGDIKKGLWRKAKTVAVYLLVHTMGLSAVPTVNWWRGMNCTLSQRKKS